MDKIIIRKSLLKHLPLWLGSASYTSMSFWCFTMKDFAPKIFAILGILFFGLGLILFLLTYYCPETITKTIGDTNLHKTSTII